MADFGVVGVVVVVAVIVVDAVGDAGFKAGVFTDVVGDGVCAYAIFFLDRFLCGR